MLSNPMGKDVMHILQFLMHQVRPLDLLGVNPQTFDEACECRLWHKASSFAWSS